MDYELEDDDGTLDLSYPLADIGWVQVGGATSPPGNPPPAQPNPVPGLSIGDANVPEGDSGPIGANFTVSLSAASGQPVTVQWATADGTATVAGGTLTFNPGGPLTQTIAVLVNGDTTIEPGRAFYVNLSNPSVNAAIVDGQSTGTIPSPVAAAAGNGDLVTLYHDGLLYESVSAPASTKLIDWGVSSFAVAGDGDPVTLHTSGNLYESLRTAGGTYDAYKGSLLGTEKIVR